MMKMRQDTDAPHADNRDVIDSRFFNRGKIANSALSPVALAKPMSPTSLHTEFGQGSPSEQGYLGEQEWPVDHPWESPAESATESPGESAESIAKEREVSIDELLSDPMMTALWHAYAITEDEVRQLVSDVTDRLKSQGELHRRAEALVARCA